MVFHITCSPSLKTALGGRKVGKHGCLKIWRWMEKEGLVAVLKRSSDPSMTAGL